MKKDVFIKYCREIVGDHGVLTSARSTMPYRKGYRSSASEALAVIRPVSLVELWRILKLCVEADIAVIMQAANTGLTAGSTPTSGYDRDVVVINAMLIKDIHLLDNGEQIIAFPGSTLFELEDVLKPYDRQPHSVIGSSCIGASVLGGLCNNSGGSLIERGPAYTEAALYAQITDNGELILVNELGLDLGSDPEDILRRLESGDYAEVDDLGRGAKASDPDYAAWVRDTKADTPARFNADPRRLKGAAGCAGKLAVFAARFDTFDAPQAEQTLFIGTNDTALLSELRRDILATFKQLPVSGEYMHTRAYQLAETYGRDSIAVLRAFGTTFMPAFFKAKTRFDSLLDGQSWCPKGLSDKLLQLMFAVAPNPTPKRLRPIRDRYDHYLILKVKNDGILEAQRYLNDLAARHPGMMEAIECDPTEAEKLFQIRFAAAGAAIRYQALNGDLVEGILPLDIALKRNDIDWFETLPPAIDANLLEKIYYGHFFCHVLHQDYIVKTGTDCTALKAEILAVLDARGAEYPAEHNVGHLYKAKPALAAHYKKIDPTNSLNPGIGQMSKKKDYGE